MKKENWVWMPHPGHFICGHRCQFHLNTYVGKYIVSTVGELPKFNVVVPSAEMNSGWEEIGYNRQYETMVFKAKKSPNKCCPYECIVEDEFDRKGYNSAEEAYKGHLELCKKWSKL